MDNKNLKNFLQHKSIKEIEILSLISSAAVLRKYKILKIILAECKRKKLKRNKVYEVFLQVHLFAGFPAALNCLQIFIEFYPALNNKKYVKNDFYKLGESTCVRIYGDKFLKLKTNINALSPEISKWFIEDGYGKVLSRKSMALKERELCIISILTCLKFESQLYSHINGAYRLGAKITEISKIIVNTEIIAGNSATKFGMKVLSAFETKRKQANNP